MGIQTRPILQPASCQATGKDDWPLTAMAWGHRHAGAILDIRREQWISTVGGLKRS